MIKFISRALVFAILVAFCESATYTYVKFTMQNGKTQQSKTDYDAGIVCPNVQNLAGKGNGCLSLVYRSPITKVEVMYQSGYTWSINISNDKDHEFV